MMIEKGIVLVCNKRFEIGQKVPNNPAGTWKDSNETKKKQKNRVWIMAQSSQTCYTLKVNPIDPQKVPAIAAVSVSEVEV